MIIGAGAAGLYTAKLLADHGRKVTVLEARDRLGGRIHPIRAKNSDLCLELGAEFIHGEAKETTALFNEAGFLYNEIGNRIWQYQNGRLSETDDFGRHFKLLEQKLRQVETDITLRRFIEEYLPQDKDLIEELTDYIEGYDLADIDRVSTISFREEWLAPGNAQQFRPQKGYGPLIESLEKQSRRKGATIITGCHVHSVHWEKNNVTVSTNRGDFKGAKVVITVPVGVLQLAPDHPESITFFPEVHPPAFFEAFGFGSVTKIVLQISDKCIKRFAGSVAGSDSLPTFIFSDQSIPTWWPDETTRTLTGWLPGRKNDKVVTSSRSIMMEKTATTLAAIFGEQPKHILEEMDEFEYCDWKHEPFTHGAYSYITTQSVNARKMLTRPAEETIYYAGEAFAEGAESGTVEAALVSAKRVSEQILKPSQS